jgi:signal transduction histidine kinase
MEPAPRTDGAHGAHNAHSTARALPSISTRLLRTLLVWSVVITAALSAAVWWTVNSEIEELLDETLQAAAQALSMPLDSGRGVLQGELAGAVAAALPHDAPMTPSLSSDKRFVWQVVRHTPGAAQLASQVLSSSAGAPSTPLHAAQTLGLSNAQRWRVYGMVLPGSQSTLYVAQASTERREAQLEVTATVALTCIAIALLTQLWLRSAMRKELAPLHTLAQRLSQLDLFHQAPLGRAERRELQPIHDALDALGQRLERRVTNERAFSGHAAHALRTPLAGINAQLAVALREAPPELTGRLQKIRAASDRLQRVVTALLALFRSGVDLKLQSLTLPEWLKRLPIEGVSLNFDASADQALQADPDLLAAALINLLDNALRHGASQVTVSMPTPYILRLHDNGTGCTAQQRETLQHAIQTQSYEGTTGLGLMLADIVARAHGGHLALPAVDAGFAVELRLVGKF